MPNTDSTSRRLPAEWEPQDAILLAWPQAESDWQPVLEQIIPVYIELVRQISRFERVLILTSAPDSVARQLASAGLELGGISLYQLSTNDTWCRDFGPITVFQDADPLLLDFSFNGWGHKFPATLDNQATRRLHAAGAFGRTQLEDCDLILEGGSIESDGAGTLLTSCECLLSPNRNPHLNKQQLESTLRQTLGAEHFLWVDQGYLAGDDTDSHIDTLARFCPDAAIAYQSCTAPQDEHYPALKRLEKQLRSFRTRTGNPFQLIPLPWPQASYAGDGQRLPATYANFLIINQAVLVPTYADPTDDIALSTLSTAFPGREIIGIDCRPVIEQYGSLHCLTMQIPQGVLP